MRMTREQVLMESARLWANRSTCSRAMVGASIIRDGRVLMSGYNGAPPGLPHCDHGVCTCKDRILSFRNGEYENVSPHRDQCGMAETCYRAVHAEQNAINYCARNGVATEGAEIYVTFAPCLACAKSIISAGLISVTYDMPYRKTGGVELLKEAGISVSRYQE